MASKLTQHMVEAARGRDRPYEIRDGGTRGVVGLLLRVQPSGRKSYYVEFGRGRRMRLGSDAITLTKARTDAKAAKAEAESGRDPRRSIKRTTLGDFLENVYRPHFSAHHRTDHSLDNLNALRPMFGKALSQVTESQVKAWRRVRLDAGVNPATINRNVSALKTALKYAVDEGYLPEHPLAGLGNLKVEQKHRVRYLSAAEETTLRAALDAREGRIRKERDSANEWRKKRGYTPLPDLSNLPFADYLKPMTLLTLNTGLRRGELFRLRWADVINDDSITVKVSKSGKARHIPLNAESRRVLRDWRSAGTEVYVFEPAPGEPFTTIKKAWNKLMVDAGLVDFRWHDLRHNFASKLVMASVPLNTVRELLGHSEITMTLRYAHLAPGHMREAVEAIGA